MIPAKRTAKILFVTGTDTGIGKTVVATSLTRYLRCIGVNAVAFKPICSGSRADARRLWRAAGSVLPLDEINPWHFRLPLAPVLAARRAGCRVSIEEILHHLHELGAGFDRMVIEGAGGLLSPLGDDFDSRDLILALHAKPIVVAPNKLGAVNQVRLALEALPWKFAAVAEVVLVDPMHRDRASKTNPSLLSEFIPPAQIHRFPWLSKPFSAALKPAVRRTLAELAA